MGSLGGGALLKVALHQTGRKLHKPILVKDISGYLASCIRVNLLSTHPPLDDKVLRSLVDESSDSGSRIPRLDNESARRLARNFTSADRQLLLKEIQEIKGDEAIREFSGSLASLRWRSRFGRPASVGEADPTGRFCLISTNWLKQRLMTSIPKPTPGQLIHTALFNSIPFIGFGFLDNVIMITAGDYIEASVGVAFSISTMAAAALGNAVSDVAGIGSAFYVEMWAMRIGIPAPNMTPEQHDLKIALWFSNIGRAFGVAFGCLLGMFPLFFLPGHNKQDEPAGTVVPVVNAEDAPVVTSPDAAVVTSSDAPDGQSKAKSSEAPADQSKAKFSEVTVTMRLPPPIPVSTAVSCAVAVPTTSAVVSSSSPATPPSSPDHTNTTRAPSAAVAAATTALVSSAG